MGKKRAERAGWFKTPSSPTTTVIHPSNTYSFPTPDHTHLPTPVTQRRSHKTASGTTSGTHLPTPQTLPRKRTRSSPGAHDDHDHDDAPFSPPSPSGHTTFFLSHAAAAETAQVQPPRRRPGLLFAQQMGISAGPSTSQPLKFGARLGAGVGMGGGMRNAHGKLSETLLHDDHDDNPFVEHKSTSSTSTTKVAFALSEPRSPGTETRYIPQAVRPSVERSLSPLSAGRAKGSSQPARMLFPSSAAESSSAAARRKQQQMMMMDEDDNPFISKPGEVVRAKPTSEDRPVVTYVFRGAKKVFANPFIAPNATHPGADLEITDPDFDVHPCPPPRLLWPTKESTVDDEPAPQTPKPRANASRRRLAAHQSLDMHIDAGALTDDDDFVPEHADEGDDDEDLDATPKPRRGLLFGHSNGSGNAAGASGNLGKHSLSPDASSRKRARAGL